MAETFKNALRVVRRPRFDLSADFDARAWGLGFMLDFGVVRTGEEGIERGWDLDLTLIVLHVCLSVYVVPRPYRRDEHVLEALIDYTEGPDGLRRVGVEQHNSLTVQDCPGPCPDRFGCLMGVCVQAASRLQP